MITIGPSKHSPGGVLRFGYYMPSPGDIALRLAMWVDSDEGREYVASHNIPEAPLPSGFVYIKNWGANEGVLEALDKAGVIHATGRVQRDGGAVLHIVELSGTAMAELEQQDPAKPPLSEPAS